MRRITMGGGRQLRAHPSSGGVSAPNSPRVESAIALHPMTIDSPMPSGQTFKALQRSRGTINGYVNLTTKVKWYEASKPATLTGLERRWRAQKSEIEAQFNLDMQRAYSQCHARTTALNNMHWCLRFWTDTAQAKYLLEIIEPLRSVDAYLWRVQKVLGRDLQVVRAYGLIYEKLYESGMSINEAFQLLKLEDLVAWRAACMKGLVDDPMPTPLVKEEMDDPKEDLPDGADAANGEVDKPTENTQTPAKMSFLPLKVRFDMTEPASSHGARLVAEGAKRVFFDIDEKAMANDEHVEKIIKDLSGVLKLWKGSWLEESAGGGAEDVPRRARGVVARAPVQLDRRGPEAAK